MSTSTIPPTVLLNLRTIIGTVFAEFHNERVGPEDIRPRWEFHDWADKVITRLERDGYLADFIPTHIPLPDLYEVDK